MSELLVTSTLRFSTVRLNRGVGAQTDHTALHRDGKQRSTKSRLESELAGGPTRRGRFFSIDCLTGLK